jgi:hypothetical protein
VRMRIDVLQKKLVDHESCRSEIEKYLTVAERVVMAHTRARLLADIGWHQEVLEHRLEIIADERNPKDPGDA